MRFHRARKIVVPVLAAAAWLVAVQPAIAADEPVSGLTPAEQELLGGDVTPTEDGLYEVEVAGADLITHGPDPERLATRESAGGYGFQPGDAERPPACATDYYQHVLYARTPGSPDRLSQVRGQIQAAIARMNAVLNNSAIVNGGVSADYKVLCDSAGQVRVDGFVSPSGDFDDIVDAARAAGATAPNADYTIFFDGDTSSCGIGSYIDDERLIASNRSNSGGGFAVTYQDCWYTDAPMHENGHTQGAVQYSSPNSTGSGGHCNDEVDVMCYSPDGGDLRQGGTVMHCAGSVQFDCGGDDYFDPAPEAGEYLSSHWNLGSPLNRFIVFSAASQTPPPAGGSGGGSVLPPVVDVVTGTVTSLAGKRQGSSKSAPEGGWQYFKTRVSRGREVLRVTMPVPESVDLDLFVRRGNEPTLGRFNCQSASNRSEVCTIHDPKPGNWFVGAYTYEGGTGVPFTVRVNQWGWRR